MQFFFNLLTFKLLILDIKSVRVLIRCILKEKIDTYKTRTLLTTLTTIQNYQSSVPNTILSSRINALVSIEDL